MTEAWLAGDKTGDERRPVVRATVQKVARVSYPYDSHDELNHLGYFNTYLFGQGDRPVELFNIRSLTWSRSIDQDVAEATLVLANTDVVPIGAEPPAGADEDFELSGLLSPSRGLTHDVSPWGYDQPTAWTELLVPDRLVRTYEGYGCDLTVPAIDDPHLVSSGVWWIDEVNLKHDGSIEVKMRDYGRILLDQIVFPGRNMPYFEYPMMWETRHPENVQVKTVSGGSWVWPTGRCQSSNKYYIGQDIETSDGSEYVSADGTWNGDRVTYPLNSDPERYWTSTGQTGSGDDGSRVWWEVNVSTPRAVAAVKVLPRSGGPYRVYISVGGTDTPNGEFRWYGRRKISYKVTTEDVDVHADIPFVATEQIARDQWTTLVLPKVYKQVTVIRVTFVGLVRLDGTDEKHIFRGSLRGIQIYRGNASEMSIGEATVSKTMGNYSEYSEIVRFVTAWSGYFWPEPSSGDDYWLKTGVPISKHYAHLSSTDAALGRGRSWGEFMNSGTAGIADLTADQFDKQPFMTVIQTVADTLGYRYWTDEDGGFVFRLPNIWKLNNRFSPNSGQPRGAQANTTEYVTLNEDTHLLSWSTTLSSRNLRELVYVANSAGKPAVLTTGYAPIDVELGRVAGWCDGHWKNREEAGVVADLSATIQKFSYRTGSARIYGYPKIQIDDQIRVYERTTNETYFHYVKGISNSIDMENGTWFYDLTTHWLGEEDTGSWVVDVPNTNPRLYRYLQLTGTL